MKSPYVSDIEADQIVTGVFLVQHKDIRRKKSGEPYLTLTLGDRTGEIDSRMWDNAAEVMDTFDRGDYVRVKGLPQVFQNRMQFTVHKLQFVPETEADPADFFPASKRDRDEMFRELQGWIAGIGNPHLHGLLDLIFADQDLALAFRTAPAAKAVHHAWLGGLLEHVLSLCHLGKFAASHYAGIDLDLLIAGVILHDIGKTRELSYSRAFGYTTEGQLIGHIPIGVQMVDERIRQIPDFPPKLRLLLLHMILSHHGEMEFGSPKVPQFAEALLLHYLDNLDSKMECARSAVENDRLIEGEWTGYVSPLDRSLLKKQRYLDPPPPAAAAPAKHETGVPPRPETGVPPRPEPAVPPKRPAPDPSPFASKLTDALRSEN